MLKKEKIPFSHGNIQFEGYAVFDEKGAPRKPVILIAHAWRGLSEFEKQKAEELAEMGYIAFALDVYGKGILASSDDEASKLMMPLYLDRSLLRSRVLAGLDAIKKHPHAETNKIGAVGFCFGGLTVLELAKNGTDVKGVVSFHGVLSTKMGDQKAKLAPTSDNIISKILVLQGYEDPLVSEEDVKNFENEMTQRKVDWQFHMYGNTKHAFTNPEANFPEKGLQYNEVSAKRSWKAMTNFFDEIFPKMRV